MILTVHLNLYLIPAAMFSASVIEEGMIESPQSLQVLLLRSSNISFSPTTNLFSDKMDISCWFSSLILLFLKGRIQNPECKVNLYQHTQFSGLKMKKNNQNIEITACPFSMYIHIKCIKLLNKLC